VIEIEFENLTSNADITAVTVTTATIGSTADASAIASVIDNIDVALDTVNDKRATFGATQSRFEAVIANLQVSVENQSAARSRIMDADFAVETAATCPGRRSCNRRAMRWSRRPTSCRSRCSRFSDDRVSGLPAP
jgi:hypothetical protein